MPEAVRLNLDYYRKQAKALLKSAQTGDSAALERLARYCAQLEPGSPKLHDAQLAIAREQGFPSWPPFRAFIVESGLDEPDMVERFLELALSDGRRAQEFLAKYPRISDAGFYVALALGNHERVREYLVGAPALATVRGGPQNLEPLLYVCFSRLAADASPRAAALVETARLLLQFGADPNASLVVDTFPDNPLSCLYGASGLNNNPELTRILLDAGANPNDGESLYHSTEHADLACMKLLLEYGAKPNEANALKHILDREDLEGTRLLLAAGADPNQRNPRGDTALHWAVWRGRSARIVEALLDHGADPNATRGDGQNAYSMAVQAGMLEVAALLASRGAVAAVSALDAYLGACAAAAPAELERMLASPPKLEVQGRERLLPDVAMIGRMTSVRALLAAGVPVDSRGEHGGAALHWACWKGYADLVELLLRHGASLIIEDEKFHGTPPGWFGHGVRNCGRGCGDYAAVARLLIAAGAKFPEADVPTGREDVDAVLREHGVIPRQLG